jgi:hypothetical protein
MVEKARRILEDLGAQIMNATEARDELGLPTRASARVAVYPLGRAVEAYKAVFSGSRERIVLDPRA